MKTVLIYFLVLLISAVGYGQPFNQQTEINGTPHLIAKISKERLAQEPFSMWFHKNFDDYQPDPQAVAQLKEKLNDYTITLFMGTWCGDSKREVPRFYKVLQEADFPLERLTNVAVGRERNNYKQSPGGEHEGLNIHRVPTFILYKDGKEVNRIVEHPVESLEEDLTNIIGGNYKPNYAIVSLADQMLEDYGVEKFDRKLKRIAGKLKAHSTKLSELNTYSSVLLYSGKSDEALTISRLNALLYPDDYYVYYNLGNKLAHIGKKEEALHQYQKALQLKPEDERVQKAMEILQRNDS